MLLADCTWGSSLYSCICRGIDLSTKRSVHIVYKHILLLLSCSTYSSNFYQATSQDVPCSGVITTLSTLAFDFQAIHPYYHAMSPQVLPSMPSRTPSLRPSSFGNIQDIQPHITFSRMSPLHDIQKICICPFSSALWPLDSGAGASWTGDSESCLLNG